jgi:DNA-binding response OmpR family regulator
MPTVVTEDRPTLLLCKPEYGNRQPLIDYMTAKGFSVHCIEESKRAIDQIITRAPDIVLLDADLPTAGGYEVCSTVQPRYQGLVLLQGQDGSETSQLLAFERGADDYIQTPVSPALLWARINARLRRRCGSKSKDGGHQIRDGFDRGIDVYISRIRNLIGDNPDDPNYLKTVRGVGYQFIGHHRDVD